MNTLKQEALTAIAQLPETSDIDTICVATGGR